MKVAVIGAGIGGAAAALALARRGHDVEVLEQAEALGEVGAGLQLGPNAVKVLRALGVAPPAEGPEAIVMVDDLTGRAIAHVPMNPDMETRFGAPYWQLHRADLLSALADAAKTAGATFHLGQKVAAAPDADLVVAADGVRSGFREIVAGPGSLAYSGHVAWRALVPAAAVPDGWGRRTRLFMGPRRHMVLYPLRGGEFWNLVAVAERGDWQAEGWRQEGDPEALRMAFGDVCAEAAGVLSAVDQCILWGLFAHPPLERWCKGNVALLGDACHPMLPYLAQGAAMAIEDAWVLADCVSADGLNGLSRYEALRKPRATRVQRAAVANGKVYHIAHPLLRRGLHIGIGVRAHLPGGLIGRFGWLYGGDVT
ncbi:FAD-dependent monooxygenase [Algicella marina]|uniref:NAD(P)-binding protein n=1 Tax=Algicella marina TaxID=2683284 RepID=A0A6P1SWW9_9RHOB|nr:FAD-dependent monooxygenase [Algicella marina]QHQ34257.1 NAD(P)-binding protein [Algicella marina]